MNEGGGNGTIVKLTLSYIFLLNISELWWALLLQNFLSIPSDG